jgi:hypothetical protein
MDMVKCLNSRFVGRLVSIRVRAHRFCEEVLAGQNEEVLRRS